MNDLINKDDIILRNDILENIKEQLDTIYDKTNGGFGDSPKYLMPEYILFLLGYGQYNKDQEAIEMAEYTLEHMYKGGIFDHIGYGFFTHSMDRKWLVPDFRKTILDNTLMALVYTRAYEITGKSLYQDIGEKIFEFIIRDFLSDNGGFHSALEGKEKIYLMTQEDIIGLLDEEWGKEFCRVYNIGQEDNYKEKNIPNLIGQKLENLDANLESMIEMIFTYREMRGNPIKDTRISIPWNGLLIGSLSYGGRLFKNDFYVKKAKEAVGFILDKIENNERQDLIARGDYTFLIYGLLNLFETLDDKQYIETSKKLMDKILERIDINLESGCQESIPLEISFDLMNLIRMYRLTGEEKYIQKTEELIGYISKNINKNPLDNIYLVMALRNLI